MIKNYLLTATRNIQRNLRFSIINILGLSFGLTCCLAIFLYVKDEISYDKFHENHERIYQVNYETSNGLKLAQVPPPISPVMKEYHPEVEASARIFIRNVSTKVSDGTTERSYEENEILFADSTLSEIFSFDWINGNPAGFLLEPGKVWLSDEMAQKYFPDRNALGKELIINGHHLYQVAGVLKKYPSNSHIQFKMIFSYDDMYKLENDTLEAQLRDNFSMNWVASHSLTYVLLKEKTNPEAVNARFDQMLINYAPEQLHLGQKFSLVPLADVHLLEDVFLQPQPSGSLQYIYIFSAIAFLTLLIACFNYINLSTSQSAKRVKEIGMRKALGARIEQLFFQFIGESTLVTLIAFALALAFLNLGFPFLEQLTGKEFTLSMLLDPLAICGILTIFLITTFLGGAYPAFFISKMNTLRSLKSKVDNHNSYFSLRRVLVVFQFAISIMLISGSIIIYKQVQYLQDQPLGFSSEAVITIPILNQNFNNAFGAVNPEMRQRLNTFADEIEQYSQVKGVTFSSSVPGLGSVGRYGHIEGQEADHRQVIYTISTDYDFLNTYDIPLLAGRSFSKEAGSDHLTSFIINETAVSQWNWGSPAEAIGKEINLEGKKGNIIGVVKDFRTNSLHAEMVPILLEVNVATFNTMSVVISNKDYNNSIDFLKVKWQELFPEKAFEFTFLDNTLEELYQNEQRFGNIVGVFALFAIIVSCLGAYGLMILTTQQRLKEIGIRKVLGANVSQLMKLLLKESVILMLIGFIIGLPITWWWGNGWLENFNTKMDITLAPFVIGGAISMLLVWLVVGLQTLKAANCNPAKVIKDE